MYNGGVEIKSFFVNLLLEYRILPWLWFLGEVSRSIGRDR